MAEVREPKVEVLGAEGLVVLVAVVGRGEAKDLRTFSLLLERSVLLRDGRLRWEVRAADAAEVVGFRGLAGEGERCRKLLRREDRRELSAKLERSAGSRRGAGAMDMREAFLRRRWGEEACVGVCAAAGKEGSLSSRELSRRRRVREA